MLIGYYAVGTKGEFGNKGKLPWGSFPEELQAFRDAMKRHHVDYVLVGMRTWLSLPASFKKHLVGNRIQVAVYANNQTLETLAFAKAYPDITVWTEIDYSLKEFYSEVSVAVIGGASLLERAHYTGILDGAVISRIWDYRKPEGWEADTFLHEALWDRDHMPPSSTKLITSHISDLSFVQEYHFFGTV